MYDVTPADKDVLLDAKSHGACWLIFNWDTMRGVDNIDAALAQIAEMEREVAHERTEARDTSGNVHFCMSEL